jgi:hypothetical protein
MLVKRQPLKIGQQQTIQPTKDENFNKELQAKTLKWLTNN